jgi:hypothetical protein
MNLSEMRRVAESATRGKWIRRQERFGKKTENTQYGCFDELGDCSVIGVNLTQQQANATHIVTFSPQNCIRLLDVMDMMERTLKDAKHNFDTIDEPAASGYDTYKSILKIEKTLAAYSELKGET